MKKFFISLLAVLMVFSICSCSYNANDDINNVDEEIIELSDFTLECFGFEEARTFSVIRDEENIYHVDINGEEWLVKIKKDDKAENAKSNIAECDLEVLEIVASSKEKVINYINKSKILKDKERLVAYVNNISVKMADFANDEAVEYDSEFDSIFINNQNKGDICEWTIVHELVQALSRNTNSGVKNARYQDSLFDEVLTDIITAKMDPEKIDDSESPYFTHYYWLYSYLGCVGSEGIEAYFYGYDEILKQIPEEELDIFVGSLEHVDNSEDAVIVLSNCINDWGLEK